MQHPRTTATGLGLTLACALLAGCSNAVQEVDSDGPTYASVAELADEADLVVRGTMGELRGTETDDGGDADSPVGIPMAFFDFDVTEVIQGSAGPTTRDSIVVETLDLTRFDDGRSALTPGEELILFLRHHTHVTAPGIDTEPEFYAVVANDNGTFDVDAGAVTARSPYVISLSGDGGGSNGNVDLDLDHRMVFTMAEFGDAIRDRTGP